MTHKLVKPKKEVLILRSLQLSRQIKEARKRCKKSPEQSEKLENNF